MKENDDSDGPLFEQRYLGRVLLDEEQWRDEHKDQRYARCPTCNQDTVDRIRSLGAAQVRSLAILYVLWRGDATGWVHVARVAERRLTGSEMGGEFARLRYWDLTVTQMDERGLWAPTDRAVAFLHGRTRVPAKIALAEWRKSDKLLGFFAPLVSVSEVVKDFDLDEVLRSARPGMPKGQEYE